MILVDASVWIDFFNGVDTQATDRLTGLAGDPRLAVGDLTITEVLQGFRDDRDFTTARRLLAQVSMIAIADGLMVEAAANYRFLRGRGVTVRGTIDTLIATRCIVDGHSLLFSDRDFEPFVTHLGLISAMTG